jgi:hypothetical protein
VLFWVELAEARQLEWGPLVLARVLMEQAAVAVVAVVVLHHHHLGLRMLMVVVDNTFAMVVASYKDCHHYCRHCHLGVVHIVHNVAAAAAVVAVAAHKDCVQPWRKDCILGEHIQDASVVAVVVGKDLDHAAAAAAAVFEVDDSLLLVAVVEVVVAVAVVSPATK